MTKMMECYSSVYVMLFKTPSLWNHSCSPADLEGINSHVVNVSGKAHMSGECRKPVGIEGLSPIIARN